MHDIEDEYDYGRATVFGKCSRCKKNSGFFLADTGIGAYGYGDANGWDKQETLLSDCCEREMLGEPTEDETDESASYWENGVFHESIAALESLFDYVETEMFTPKNNGGNM